MSAIRSYWKAGHSKRTRQGVTVYASTHELLLVDGGGVGLCAAIAAEKLNHKLSIAVVAKVYPTRSHTVFAEWGAKCRKPRVVT